MADMLGVSPTTVSNVIHGKSEQVSEKTVIKVRELLQNCNYVPNMNARNLAKKDSKIIGVAVRYRKNIDNNFVQDPFTGELLGAIEKEIQQNHYYLMIYLSEEVDEILHFCTSWNVDGLIVAGLWPLECQYMRTKISKPMVFIDAIFCNDDLDYVNVGLEDRKGAYDITNYLIHNGHKRIAFVTDDISGIYENRLLGYKDALEDALIEFDSNHIIRIKVHQEDFYESLDYIYHNIEEYTALFFVSDYYAARTMNYLMDLGVNIPEDISVTGFDDNLIGQTVRPGLTTIRQNPSKKGVLAVKLLLNLIQGIEIEEKNILLKTELIIRNSVKKIE